MSGRDILNKTPDGAALFDQRYRGGERDQWGLPLGPVTQHIENRLLISYEVLCLFAIARDLQLFKTPVEVEPVGTPPQDQNASGEFQAAHLLPTDLLITPAGGPPGRLYSFFRNVFSQTHIKYYVFGKTTQVHRLTNLADSYCERDPADNKNRMRQVVADACKALVNDPKNTPLSVFETILLPKFVAAARAALQKNLDQLTPAEQREMNRRPVVDQFGRPATPRALDTRVTSSNDNVRVPARGSVNQVLTVYANMTTPPRHLMAEAAGRAEAMRVNELSVR